MKPLCVDLFCGLGGWAEGFLAEGYDVIGFDVEPRPYPGQLVLQDVRTLDGAQLARAACIVASPPCQDYSYRAMPWRRARELPPPDNTLFFESWRIQLEACEAAGRYIPLVVENVCGAQKWVGRARWHYGSYYLWGDVPALMPRAMRAAKAPGINWNGSDIPGYKARAFNTTAEQRLRDAREGLKAGVNAHAIDRDPTIKTPHLTHRREHTRYGGSFYWDGSAMRAGHSQSTTRKQATALIAKIPFDLALWIARVYKPQ